MKRMILIATALLAAAVLSNPVSGPAIAQEKPNDEKMAAYMALAKPGPEHQQLAARVGKWNVETKLWMEPGKSQAMTFKGTAENHLILGGRFLVTEAKSGSGPMSVELMIVSGFDRRSNKFTVVAFDSEGTYWVSAAGPYDESRKAVVMHGEDEDPVMGGTQKYDFVTRTINPDQYVTEVIFKDPAHTKGAPEFKAVEVTYTRVK